MTETIYARATAAGRAAVAIVRISGPDAGTVLKLLAAELPRPRQAAVRRLHAPGGEVIDQALVLWLPGPGSFTGEDCAELQVHGGSAVLGELFAVLDDMGLRRAFPGEFSRRAFANGKMDLLQAEAIADLVDAETTAQKRQALMQMSGGVGRRYENWRDRLTEALAFIEAENDFPDEDIPGAVAQRAAPLLESLQSDLRAALGAAERGRRVREGYRVALVGEPNAGKSSLFNALLGREAAIVTRHAGTTRDIVEAEMVVRGYAVILADTAGVREASEEIEAEGVRRAQAWAGAAAWRWLVIDEGARAPAEGLEALVRPGDLVVASKADLRGGGLPGLQAWAGARNLDVAEASTLQPETIAELRVRLEGRLVSELSAAEAPSATRERHQQSLSAAEAGVARALATLATAPDLAAEEVRVAAKALQAVVGEVEREAVLDRVFASFCIGK